MVVGRESETHPAFGIRVRPNLCGTNGGMHYVFPPYELKSLIYSSTHHFPIAAYESCQGSEFTKSGMKMSIAYKLFQMIS